MDEMCKVLHIIQYREYGVWRKAQQKGSPAPALYGGKENYLSTEERETSNLDTSNPSNFC